MNQARKPTRQGVLEMLRRCSIVLLCLALWATAIGFGVINAKPYTAFFMRFGLGPIFSNLGSWGSWGAFQLVQMYPSFVANKGSATWYNKVCFWRNIAFGLEAAIQFAVHLPGGLFSLPLLELAQSLVTIAGTVFAAALAMGLTMSYTATWGSESPLHGRTVNTQSREA